MRTALRGSLVNQGHDPLHIPQGIGDASGHRRGDAKALVNANEVLPDEVEHRRVAVVVDPQGEIP